MVKTNVCVLFGGVSPEHEVSLRSAESVLNHLDPEKYNVLPVGITKEGNWVLYGGSDYSKLPTNEWLQCPDNRRAFISPIHGQGLVIIDGDRISKTAVDVIFPVLHGENGEDGTVQGLFQLAGIPYVGCGVASSASCMDKCLTKLTAEKAQVRQADWELVTRLQLRTDPEAALDRVERRFTYPVFVKPAGTGSSVGVSKARSRAALLAALENAVRFEPLAEPPDWRKTYGGAPYIAATENYILLSWQESSLPGDPVATSIARVAAVPKREITDGRFTTMRGESTPPGMVFGRDRGLWNSLCPLDGDSFLLVSEQNGRITLYPGHVGIK